MFSSKSYNQIYVTFFFVMEVLDVKLFMSSMLTCFFGQFLQDILDVRIEVLATVGEEDGIMRWLN